MLPGADRRRHPRGYVAGTARLLVGQRKVGDYLVENVSAGGVLLSCGPVLSEGMRARVLLRLSGLRDLLISGVVVRRQTQDDGGHELAVRLLRVSSAAQDLIQQAVLRSLERENVPSILAIHSNIGTLAGILRDLDKLKRRSILACTPLDVVRWLSDPDTVVEAALVERTLAFDDGLKVLRFIAREYPSVRRVLVSGPLSSNELEQYHQDRAVDALLLRPWRVKALATALAQTHSHRPLPPATPCQRTLLS